MASDVLSESGLSIVVPDLNFALYRDGVLAYKSVVARLRHCEFTIDFVKTEEGSYASY